MNISKKNIIIIVVIYILLIGIKYIITYRQTKRCRNIISYEPQLKKNPFQKTIIREDIETSYFDENNNIINYRLKDFFIPSAFKPYQCLGSNTNVCSKESILLAINKGARFHYLDIYSTDGEEMNSEPIIKNNSSMENKYGINFNEICKLYSENSWLNESWVNKSHNPLILYFNIQESANNKDVQDKMAYYIYKNFKDNLLPIHYSYSKINIADASIKDLLNKVIILTNIDPVSKKLKELTSSIVNKNSKKIGRITTITYKQAYEEGGVKAIQVNSDEFKTYNKKNIGILIPEQTTTLFSSIFLQNDLYQIPSDEPMLTYGFNIVAIYYQMPGKFRKKYLRFFSEKGLRLKPEHLRDVYKKEEEKEEIEKIEIRTLVDNTDSNLLIKRLSVKTL